MGKCSIGGYRDGTTTSFATGGINKDSTREEWSPHFDMHADAAQVAQQATIDLLLDIRNEVNNDMLFLPFLGLNTPPTVSIALVIDTTWSLFNPADFAELVPATATVLNDFSSSRLGVGLEVNYILVPFDDTGMLSLFHVMTSLVAMNIHEIEEFPLSIASYWLSAAKPQSGHDNQDLQYIII